ncbi:hypothetical protein HML84_15035 [Alcanivorax sp. IO_7]|nr:hypothetical protein HML84_15035 [Alcanivorax sp. IO_7]
MLVMLFAVTAAVYFVYDAYNVSNEKPACNPPPTRPPTAWRRWKRATSISRPTATAP